MTDDRVLRLGVLGAANISTNALYAPVASVDRVELVAIAARDRSRAEAHAAEHGIEMVVDDYETLVGLDGIDAVFNPLPISLHHRWTIAALEAGKHVLCEKPFASNADEAAEMVAAGHAADRVLVEAFHWRYHPLADRITELVDAIGGPTAIRSAFTVPIREDDEVRRTYELSGGALMDLGCYPVQWARHVAGREPVDIEATMVPDTTPGRERVDVDTRMRFDFGDGLVAELHTAMTADAPRESYLEVDGPDGTFRVVNPLAPQFGHEVISTIGGETRSEQVAGVTTYHHQMEAFVAAVLDGTPCPTGGEDAIATMRAIDACYTSAGLPIRGL